MGERGTEEEGPVVIYSFRFLRLKESGETIDIPNLSDFFLKVPLIRIHPFNSHFGHFENKAF